MTVETITAVLLIAVPIAFNLAFFELGRAFDYPNILRKEPDEILRRFDAGGSGLILRWEALLVSALLMLPIAALLAVVLTASPALTVLSVVVGATAAIVQGLGLVRWPFAVPELARRYVAAPDGAEGDATRKMVEVVFATLHRLLGVGIGEHLGYLFTGLWTLLVSASIVSTAVMPSWLGVVGVLIGIALLVGTLEFVGPNERRLAPRRHDRPDRLHRLVALDDPDRHLAARSRELAIGQGAGRDELRIRAPTTPTPRKTAISPAYDP